MNKRGQNILSGLLVIVLLFFATVWFSIPMTAMRVDDSVVMVYTYTLNYSDNYVQRGTASGVIIDDDIILTAKHVIEGTDKIVITTIDGVEFTSKEFVEADDTDLGLIIFDANDMTQSNITRLPSFIGQTVFGIGCRFNLNHSFFKGVVGTISRSVPFFGNKNLIQLDIAGNPGDSGCPIYNRFGGIVGILVGGKRYADGVTYIVPAKICRLFLKQYEADRNMERAE